MDSSERRLQSRRVAAFGIRTLGAFAVGRVRSAPLRSAAAAAAAAAGRAPALAAPWLSASTWCIVGPEATVPSINSSRGNLKNSSQASWRSVAKGPLRSQDGLK